LGEFAARNEIIPRSIVTLRIEKKSCRTRQDQTFGAGAFEFVDGAGAFEFVDGAGAGAFEFVDGAGELDAVGNASFRNGFSIGIGRQNGLLFNA